MNQLNGVSKNARGRIDAAGGAVPFQNAHGIVPFRVEFDTRQIRSLRGRLAEAIQNHTANVCRVTLDRHAVKAAARDDGGTRE